MTELPRGWISATLDEVATTSLGKMLSAKAKSGLQPRPYLRNKNVQWGRFDLEDIAEMDFTDEEFERFGLVPGDLLVCEGGDVGRAAIWRGQIPRIAYQKALHRIRARPGVEPGFLLYLFMRLAQTNALEPFVTGSTIKHLPQEDLRELPVPLPPMNEQRRIVAAIEEQFSRLDAADSLLRRAGTRVPLLRDSVHSLAMFGEWPTAKLGELLREPLRNGHSAKASREGKVRALTLTAVTRGAFTDENTKLTSADPIRIENLWLEPGDVLIERSNTPELVGTAALYDGPRRWAIFPDLLIRVRVSDELLPEFLAIALKSQTARRYFQASAQGIAGSMPKIDQGVVERLEVSVPPTDEQQRIVENVEQRLSVIDAMRDAIDIARRRSATLRRSILEQAFRGELVPGDLSDEPASALLERIAGERPATAPKRRRTVTA